MAELKLYISLHYAVYTRPVLSLFSLFQKHNRIILSFKIVINSIEHIYLSLKGAAVAIPLTFPSESNYEEKNLRELSNFYPLLTADNLVRGQRPRDSHL